MGSSSTQPPLSNEQGREVHTSVGNCHPRKISIGILPDSSSQSRAKDFAIQTGRAPTRGKPISAKDGKNLKQKEAPEHETSPWISTRSFCHQLPVPEQPHGTGEPTPPVLLSKKPVVEKDNRVHDSKGGATIGVEKVSFATMRFMSKKNVGEHATAKTETKGSETLRMKLWEILGTIAPSNNPRQNSHCFTVHAKNMSSLQSKDQENVPVAKARQNSDTIEMDSQSPPDVIVGRLRTRSLTRKGAAGSLKESKMENAPSTHPTKGKKGGNNNSVLKEGFSRRLRYGISGGPKTSTRKICERFSAGTGAHILFSDEVENQPANSRNKGMHCHVKSHLQGDIEKSKGVFFQPKRVDLEFDSHMSEHLNKKVSCPKILENVSQAKEKLDDVCPTFGVNLTKEGCYPESLPMELGGADNGSPGKPLLSKKGIHSFKSFFSSRSKFVESDTEQEDSPYAVGQFEKSPPMKKSKPVIEEPECRMPLSSSSSEDSDLQTSREAPRAKVLEEDCNRQPRLDSNEEDGLRSIVSLFALALERVKSNMKSMVKKKCAEILMSAAEGIQLQLQTAESQIQADMVTLNSINKLKRKRVDARFEELQGQLKVLHERYKDDVNRHLQDCRSTVESLEAHQLELKATVEKQCLSHNKLISQAEKAIETQLNDAQKRITEVHNLARKKMSQLKHDVADCF
ncbi:OLC1v1003624C1 [Oldenlandia corymbosa var. corymbosa]|uniref:OLC1v1003624C1 n=1 Tax=Oldenlandia corymbosa var. corymbosa TaxID=529605 RepID=A0AAV1DD74_OLDCO|nr:OLC1v1003624C1 [Oldenlandia corymbosa var. corymbosa]